MLKQNIQYSYLLILALTGIGIFMVVTYSLELPDRIRRGLQGAEAIRLLDEIRRPLLAIKQSEIDISHNTITDKVKMRFFEQQIEKLTSLVQRYRRASRYNLELAALVDRLVLETGVWIEAERRERAHGLQRLTPTEMAVERRRLYRLLQLLAEGERPVHRDIEDGSQAMSTLQWAGMGLLGYLFFVLLIFQYLRQRETHYAYQTLALLSDGLQEREKLLDMTLNSIGDAVIATDTEGHVTRMNPVAETLTGWVLSEAMGLPLTRVFHIVDANTRDHTVSPVDEVLTSGKITGLPRHTLLIGRDGKEYRIADSAAPITDSDGRLCGVILVFRDITTQYHNEQALRQSQKMEAIGLLSGGIAHDFNNQLGVIIGYLDILATQTGSDTRQGKWLAAASRASLRCMDLTRQLLSFARRQGRDACLVDLNQALRELDTMIERSLTPEVEVVHHLADDLWLTRINPDEFQDVLLNLVINARDAMPDGGRLVIETDNRCLGEDYVAANPGIHSGDFVVFSITDNGSGMDRRTLERVFEPFFTTKEKGKGTGLGMAMVYAFAQRYGGNVKVYSEPGVGTIVRLYLPRTSDGQDDFKSAVPENELLPQGNETVLVVDDEEDLLLLAKQYLESLGYQVLTASSGRQALEVLRQHEDIDLLFSDVVMPHGMNGYELAGEAVALYPEIRVLLTSGFTARAMVHNGLARFSADLLAKPYRRAELAQRVRKVLDRGC